MLRTRAPTDVRLASRNSQPPGVKPQVVALIAATAAAGAAIAAVAALQWGNENLLLLAVLAGFAVFSVRFDISLFYQSRVSVTVVPILVAATIAGLPGVLVVALAAELAAYLGRGKPYYKSVFNAGALLMSGAAYVWVLHSFPIGNDGGGWPGLIYPAVAGTLVNFLVNSVLVGLVIALASERSIFTVWKENYSSLPLHYVMLGVLVAGMASAYRMDGIATMALVFVPVVIMRFAIKLQQVHKELQDANQKLLHLAYHDALTDLPNRQLFEDRLTTALAQARRKEQMVALLFLDLDGFKLVNDALGHAVGDRLLQQVAERLRNLVRQGDSVARVGGDEFTLLSPDVATVEDALEIAKRVLESLGRSWALDSHELHITASIGVAIYPNHGEDSRTLLKNADTAMYRAKEQGRDDYQLYTAAVNANVAERVAQENLLSTT